MNNVKSLLLALTAVMTSALSAQSINDLKFGPQQEQQGQQLDGVAAIVGDDIITRQELNRLGGSSAALERLIMQKLLLQAAKQRNITIGDTALNIALSENKGKPISREQLRKQLIIQKLQQKMANSLVHISDNEVENAVEKQLKQVNDQVQLVDILVKVPQTADSDTLQRAQEKTQKIQAQLKTQDGESVAAQYDDVIYNDLGWVGLSQIPTSFSETLISAPENQYLSPIVDRDGIHLLKILARKSDGKTASAVSIPETRAAHILVKTKDNPNAKAMIDDLYQRLKNGENFEDLAKQYSQDMGSAVNGGSLDWVYPGQMVPDFEAVMNATPTGKISKPFKSSFGYHIIKVYERRQVSKNNSDAMKQQVRQAIFQNRAAEAWTQWLAQLRDESYVQIMQ